MRRSRLRHSSAAIVVAVGLAIVVLVAPHAGATIGTPVGGNSAWCNVRVSAFTAGATYEAWASCTFSPGADFSHASNTFVRVRLFCNGVDQGSELIGGRNLSGAAGVTTYTYPATRREQIHYENWEWYNSCANPLTQYATAGASSSSAAVSGGGTVQDDSSHRTNGEGLGLVLKLVGGAGFPPYPTEAGADGVAADPLVACSVDLTTASGSFRAQFQSAVSNTDTSNPDSFSWDFGDTSTATTQSPSHNYATGDNAGAKWHAVLTTTRPNATNAATCVIDFDFYGPSHVDGDDGPLQDQDDDATDDSCPAWPHKWLFCQLKHLFISGDTGDHVDELKDTALEHWPFAPVVWFGEQATGAGTDLNAGDPGDTGLAERSTSPCSTLHVEMPLPRSDPDNHTPYDFDLLPDTNDPDCDGPGVSTPLLGTISHITFALSTMFAFVLAVFAVRGLVTWVMGDGSAGE